MGPRCSRSSHSRLSVQTEVDSTKDTLRRLEAKMSRSGGLPTDSTLILNERCQQMAARLEQEEDSARSQKRVRASALHVPYSKFTPLGWMVGAGDAAASG